MPTPIIRLDDLHIKEQIVGPIPESDLIYQPSTLLDYCYLIRDSELLISTSTGPMHLAGALNIKTVSFFGDNLFASFERWAVLVNKIILLLIRKKIYKL